MNIKQSTLAAAVTAALALGASGQASAYVYGASGLSIDNLTIGITGASSVTVNRFDFTQTNQATLDGATVASSATCGGTPSSNNCTQTIGRMDAAAVNATGSAPLRTNNQMTGGEFTFLGVGATDYSNADSWIVQAELVNLGNPTVTHNIAESLLATDTGGIDANSKSEIQSITGFSILFTVGTPGPANFTLNFDADPDVMAAIFGEDPAGSYSAQANLNASFTLKQNTGGSLQASWTPLGTFGAAGDNDCLASAALTCIELADSQSLNINAGTTSNNTSDPRSWDPNDLNLTHFGMSIAGLTAGSWTLTLNESKSNQLARTVPEPASLALLGIGLLGLGASARRNKKQA